MKAQQVRDLYDASYASTYEEKFLLSPLTTRDTAHELKLIECLLTDKVRWLDVACGTGLFFRHFPQVSRVGTDLSPAMLDRARQGNPGVQFFEHDFRQPKPEWTNGFGLVSCMWYAYTLVDTMDEISGVIANLAAWTSPSGSCFLPLADPHLISRSIVPYDFDTGIPGRVTITAILWNFEEENGAKVHRHLVTPQIPFMVHEFEQFFAHVEIVRYPPAAEDAPGRPALIAKKKK